MNMLKYTLKVLIPLTIIFVVGCTGKSPIPQNFVADLDEIRPLTDAEVAENEAEVNEYNRTIGVLEERAVADVAEKKVLLKEKKVVQKAKKELKELTKKILKKRKKKLLKAEVKKIAKAIKEGSSQREIVDILEQLTNDEITEKEAKALLREYTTLTEKEIKKLIGKTKKIQKDTEELAKELATASAEEAREILEEAGGVSKSDILALVSKKKSVEVMETSFLEKTMAQLYGRLIRDRELGIEEAFCINIEGILDHLLVPPSYFETNKYDLDQYLNEINKHFALLEPVLAEYPDIIISLEGNTDERGTVEYNKALSDRRWNTPEKILLALYFDENRTQGLGRSEQCPLGRDEGTSTKDWWSKNRRTDYIFKLQ